MLFNSPTFLLFFAAVFCLYWLLRGRVARNALLLVASYVFYGAWSWKFVLLLGFTTLLDYSLGRLVAGAADGRPRRHLVVVSAIANLGVLAVFKYSGFFVAEAASLLQSLGLEPHLPVLQVALPIGLSFYTFQSLGYVIDVYRGKVPGERNLLDYALFVAFFPQLVAGPIERAAHMLPQYKEVRKWSTPALESGLQLVVWGLFKKMVIADNLAPYVDAAYATPGAYSNVVLITATVFFAFQIYCDVSGYSDIARGAARMLGFDLVSNFNLPYFSRSPVDFWQRWHISLSQWFRDYVYQPLARFRYGAAIVTMVLIGLWHGASGTFIAFGLYWGLAIALCVYWSDRSPSGAPESGRSAGLPPALSTAGMFVVACFGWILFRASSLEQAWTVFSGFFSAAGESRVLRLDVLDARILWALVLGLWAVELIYLNRPRFLEWIAGGRARALVWRYSMVTAIVLSYVVTQQGRAQPFIYFQF